MNLTNPRTDAYTRTVTPTGKVTGTLSPTPSATTVPGATHVSSWLPLTLGGYLSYFEGPWEAENNHPFERANRWLRVERDYNGHPDDSVHCFGL
jgi:hypothetical protein